jgi:DNA-binding MarR family transcriptional regulator
MLERTLTYNLAAIVEDGIGKANHLFVREFGWSVRELRVLRLVRASPGITFTNLAAATKFERSLTSRTLSRLIKAGLIERVTSMTDARVHRLTATAAGDAVCARADPMTATLEGLVMQPLTARERAEFLAMVDKVRDWVQAGYGAAVDRAFPGS